MHSPPLGSFFVWELTCCMPLNCHLSRNALTSKVLLLLLYTLIVTNMGGIPWPVDKKNFSQLPALSPPQINDNNNNMRQ